jgi:hypothetical protein
MLAQNKSVLRTFLYKPKAMLKVFLLVSIILVQSFFSKIAAQVNSDLYKSMKHFEITSIDATNEDYSDLQFLKETLKDKKIVLLGEQSHGEGATFAAKVRLVKFLHQELGFDIISFESGLYDNYKTFQLVHDFNVKDSPLKESIYRIWSETKEFEPLLQYIHRKSKSSSPLIVAGFDSQDDQIFKKEYLADLLETLNGKIVLNEKEYTLLQEVIEAGPEFIVDNEEDSILFFSTCSRIKSNLEKINAEKGNDHSKILLQTLEGWLAMLNWQIDIVNEVDVAVQNPRDLQMAKNLEFLSRLYPDKKIIGWGASYHFANQIELFKNTSLTKSYVKKLDSLQKSSEPTNLDHELDGAIPMGKILKDTFGESLYSLAFTSYEGEFGMLGFTATSLSDISPPKESLEYNLVQRGSKISFMDFSLIDRKEFFYISALGNVPIYAPWADIFDGLLFIRFSTQPRLAGEVVNGNRNAEIKSTAVVPIKNSKSYVKKVVDKENQVGISYANVYILNTSKGVATNFDGDFTFQYSKARRDDKVIISAIGYHSDTIAYKEFLLKKNFELKPSVTQLDELTIRSKPLKAKEIVKLAEKRIKDNYYQGKNEQEFFYRIKQYKEDSVIFNEEAAVSVYNQIGYQSSNNATKHLKGNILQYRNTTQNAENKNLWQGVGSLWLVYTHDLILDKDNVLHRSTYYELELQGITTFENKKVYNIRFSCNRPGAYTTGFGYPSPKSATGNIYIDVETYTVLKFEILIDRKPFKNKRQPHMVLEAYGHHIVQTYKQFEGKYFLNYSKQSYYSRWTNTKKNITTQHLEERELLSTQINVNPTQVPTLSLMSIKSQTPKEDAAFWQTHNLKMEDNIVDTYKKFKSNKD